MFLANILCNLKINLVCFKCSYFAKIIVLELFLNIRIHIELLFDLSMFLLRLMCFFCFFSKVICTYMRTYMEQVVSL